MAKLFSRKKKAQPTDRSLGARRLFCHLRAPQTVGKQSDRRAPRNLSSEDADACMKIATRYTLFIFVEWGHFKSSTLWIAVTKSRCASSQKGFKIMAEEVKVDTPADAAAKAEDTASGEKPVEKTVAQITEDAAPAEQKPAEKPAETVGLDKFLDVKNENKDLRKRLEVLEKSVNKGASVEDVADDIAAIGDEFNVDKTFLAKLSKAIQSKAEAIADAKAEEKMKPFLKGEREKKIDEAFQTHYSAALEAMPEYKDIANADVIKTLSLLPKNKDKTFPQIIEETYGKVVSSSGRKTIERTSPGGGKDPAPLDFAKARKDTAYFEEVMANPTLKAEYNKRMIASS